MGTGSRKTRLAEMLVDYSVAVKPGDKVLVESIGVATLPLAREVVSVILERGGLPYTEFRDEATLRRWLIRGSEEQIAAMADFALPRMQGMKCYIGIRGADNTRELSDVPPDKLNMYSRHFGDPVHMKCRVPNTRWVVLRFPNNAMAQQAQMPTEALADLYYRVCLLDYGRMSMAMDPLADLMRRTDRVRIVAPGTELAFSIKGQTVVKCDGHKNIPDGEDYTAPIKESINGHIRFNTPSLYEGTVYPNLTVVFRNGKAVEAKTDGDNDRLNAILDRDPGARFTGEFALGVNPHVTVPMLDTLFDEKIAGSLHIALGNSYDDCDNGNKSQNHWDWVLRQTPDTGGGEIWFDEVLVRKDGLFVLPELVGLNPENLV